MTTAPDDAPVVERSSGKRILIVGCGYLGSRVAENLSQAGHSVAVLTRSPAKAARLSDAGYTAIVGDLLDPATVAQLPDADALLVAVTHDRSSGVPRRDVLVDGVAKLVQEMHSRIGRVIYVSSTGVYGQSDGSWIDEESPTEPSSEGGQLTLEAERALLQICNAPESGCELTILRLAGIYGPGRLIARTEQLRSGTPVAGSPDAWLNLIHVDDAALLISRIAEGRGCSQIILMCDDRPVRRGEFYGTIAREIGAPPPSFDPDAATTRTRGLNKRCRNARMHAELIDEESGLLHPDSIAEVRRLIGRERADSDR